LSSGGAGEPLVLTKLSTETMGLLVDWLYARLKESITWEQRLALFHANHMYQICELQLECEYILTSSVSSETLPVLADIAESMIALQFSR